MSLPQRFESPARIIPITPVAASAPSGVDAATEQSLYEVRRKIYPRALHGWFAGWRWTLVWFTQLIFYGLPWFDWNGRQVVLFDLSARQFFIFGFVFWPQDFIYLTLLLVCSALGLFLFTAVGGRLWCGYACPQTVYTEIFLWIERKIEGDRYARMKLDAQPNNLARIRKKAFKHTVWIALSLWTGVTFVGYFTPIRTLVPEIGALRLGPWEGFWILFYGLATYGNAGWLREQVCKYMCPYARFQSAMFDKDTLVVTYDAGRGEPRGSRRKSADLAMLELGHCVDCGVCVQVCPTGIDIRNGLQYECISCAACVDGCNQIMDKMGYPRGLIRHTTENALANAWSPRAMWKRVLRPRVLVYGAILVAIVASTGTALALRTPLRVDVIRDRGTGREVEVGGQSGWIENVYRVQVMNQDERPHRYVVRAEGLPQLRVAGRVEGTTIEVGPASSRAVAITAQAPPNAAEPGSHRIVFRLVAEDDPAIAQNEQAVFLIPR